MAFFSDGVGDSFGATELLLLHLHLLHTVSLCLFLPVESDVIHFGHYLPLSDVVEFSVKLLELIKLYWNSRLIHKDHQTTFKLPSFSHLLLEDDLLLDRFDCFSRELGVEQVSLCNSTRAPGQGVLLSLAFYSVKVGLNQFAEVAIDVD
jgi:hypothetical protein